MHADKSGESKIMKKCSLPLTGKKCVSTIITDKAVFDVGDKILVLKEHAPGVDLDEIRRLTDADFIVAETFKEMILD